MLLYFIKRLCAVFPMLIGITLVVFLSMHMLPGDAAEVLLGVHVTPEALAQLRAELQLDRNILLQFGI